MSAAAPHDMNQAAGPQDALARPPRKTAIKARCGATQDSAVSAAAAPTRKLAGAAALVAALTSPAASPGSPACWSSTAPSGRPASATRTGRQPGTQHRVRAGRRRRAGQPRGAAAGRAGRPRRPPGRRGDRRPRCSPGWSRCWCRSRCSSPCPPARWSACSTGGTTRQNSPPAADMLRVFAPQLPLYGVGIVLTGVLQTYRRFAWPVLAPLLSSVTVMVACTSRSACWPGATPTSAGSATANCCCCPAARRSPWRCSRCACSSRCAGCTCRCARRCARTPERRPRLRPLVVAGIVTVGGQQLCNGLAIALASAGRPGSIVIYNLAQTIFLLPWAVLALPVATTTYPALAEAGAIGDDERYARHARPGRPVAAAAVLPWYGRAGRAGATRSPCCWSRSRRIRTTPTG